MDGNQGSRRKRLLLSAYSINPQLGSEPGIGWRRALQAAGEFDTWVLCRQQVHGAAIRAWLEERGPVGGLTFCFIPLTVFEEFIAKNPVLRYVAYNRWQRRAFRLGVQLHREIGFDVIHHLTWSGFREPGYLWRLDAPFIWGPIGGTQNYPCRFLPMAGFRGAVYEGLRTVVNSLQLRYSPRVRKAARRASLILAANSSGATEFARRLRVPVERLPDVGVDSLNLVGHEPARRDRQLRILWSGRFEHRKALHLLLVALGSLGDTVSYEVKILGDGPLRNRWRRIARDTGVERHCQWRGTIPLEEAIEEYGWADVFVFTSLRDTFGTVVLEALGNGVPVICFDHFGAGDAVTDTCGMKIPVTNPRDAIRAFAQAIRHISEHPGGLEELRAGALERAREYLWENNAGRMIAYYRVVTAGAEYRPKPEEGNEIR